MNIETIFSVILSAASLLRKPIEDVAASGAKDAYEAAKDYLRSKVLSRPDAVQALDAAIEKPDSVARKAVLLEESRDLELDSDLKLSRLVNKLAKALPKKSQVVNQTANISGNNNRLQQIAGDFINTPKLIKKNQVTPDERHITGEQKRKLKPLIDELAQRLAGENCKPQYGRVYTKLEKRFNVSSYLLIRCEDFDDAVSYLKQQKAINRSKLRNRNPSAYEGDFIKKIHACRNTLGWDSSALYQFAFDKLQLKKPITSTKQLGVNQLKSLSEFIKREADKLSR